MQHGGVEIKGIRCLCRARISLGSQRHKSIAHITGVLPWMDMGSLGRTNQVSKEVELPCTPVHESSKYAWSSALGWRLSQLRVSRLELEANQQG